MRLRLVALVLAGAALAGMVAAFVVKDGDSGDQTGATSTAPSVASPAGTSTPLASSTPTASPIGTTTSPTGTPATPSPSVTVTPAMPTGTPPPPAFPLPITVVAHPPGTRTSVPAVDRLLDALQARDLAALEAFIAYREVGCVRRQDEIGSPPKCRGDEPEGTVVRALVTGACEGTWIREEDVPGFLERAVPRRLHLFAVLQVPGDDARGQYRVLVEPGGKLGWGEAFELGDAGVSGVFHGCGEATGAFYTRLLADTGGTVLLAPPDGAVVSDDRLGQSGGQLAYALAARGGALYYAGAALGQAFQGVTGPGGGDGIVARAGDPRAAGWIRVYGAPAAAQGRGHEEFRALAAGLDGSLYAAGFSDAAELAGQNGGGGDDVLLVRYTAAGERLWTRLSGERSSDRAAAVSVAPDGSVYVAGVTQPPPPLSGGAAGQPDAVVLKYSADGDLAWRKTYGGPGADEATGVAVGPDGAVYVVGTADRPDLFQAATPTGPDLLVLKYSPDGGLAWERKLAGRWWEEGGGVAVGRDGRVYATGTTGGFSDDLNQPRASAVLLAAYDPGGDLAWQITYDSPGDDSGLAITAAPAGSLYVTGRVDDTTGGAANAGHDRVLLLKVLPAGRVAWAHAYDPEGYAQGNAVAVAPDGVYVVGFVDRRLSGSSTGQDVLLLHFTP